MMGDWCFTCVGPKEWDFARKCSLLVSKDMFLKIFSLRERNRKSPQEQSLHKVL